MKLRLFSRTYSIKGRFFTLFIIISLLTYAVTLTVNYKSFNKLINKNMYHFYGVQSQSFSVLISSKIEKAQIRINTVSKFLSQFQAFDEDKRRDIYSQYLYNTLKENKDDFGIFTIWKRYTIDNRDKEFQNLSQSISGQYGVWYVKTLKDIKETPITIDQIDLLNRYSQEFSSVFRKSLILAPIKFSSPVILDTVNIVRIVMPIRDKKTGFILGIVGLDIKTDVLLNDFPPEVLSSMMITNEKMEFIYHPNKTFIGKKLTHAYPRLQTQTEIIHNLNTGHPVAAEGYFFDDQNKDMFISYPIKIGSTNWNIILRVPQKEAAVRTKKILVVSGATIGVILLSLLLIFMLYQSAIFKRTKIISKYLDTLSKGELDVDLASHPFKSKEFSTMYQAVTRLKEKLNQYAKFTQSLALGKFDEVSLEVENEKDILGKSLIQLRENLVENRKRNLEIQKVQEIENWHNSGIAKFNEIIRKNINDFENLSYEVIKELAEYVDAVVGGFFYLRHNPQGEDYLELTGFYAYSRKIYNKKHVELGEGLIGNVALEKKAIYMNVPPDYLEVISGMGKAKPEYLVIQPMISADTVYGILELAKIKEFKDYELKFIEEVSNIVASSLAASRITEETRRLLAESQKVAEEMRQKEETLKNSLMQLQEVKNKSEEQRKHLQSIVSALNEILYYVEFSPKLKVISINDLFLNKLKYSYAEATSSNYFELLNIPVEEIDKHRKYWDRLKRGEIVKFDYKIELKDEDIWIKAVLVPVTKEYNLERVIFIGIDYTEVKKKEEEVNRMIIDLNEKEERLNVQEMELELTTEELNKLYKEIEEKDKRIVTLESELEKLQTSYNILQKEFEKRLKRSRKIEASLKERIKELEEKLRKYEKGKDNKEE